MKLFVHEREKKEIDVQMQTCFFSDCLRTKQSFKICSNISWIRSRCICRRAQDFEFKGDTTSQRTSASNLGHFPIQSTFLTLFFPQTLIFTLEKTTL